MAEAPDDPATLKPRAPVVTVMGHVDHGKTSLLDRVRKASVAAGEAGGITQHIAAYEVSLPQGRVVFLDTPGHEAFTAMRARGAKITDVVVLVVAADDGVMPQTREAIDHARAAEVPIVVAINKIDKPGAQPDRIRQQLTEYDLVDEAWGGKTIMKNISAQTGEGIDELMELLVLETELLELKANPDKQARGAVIEAEVTRGQGPVAWVLVQSGTLRVGDIFLAGDTHGRVRAMTDPAGRPVKEAGPAHAVVVMGFNAAPAAGDQFMVVKDERIARAIAEKRMHRRRMKEGPAVQHVTLEDFHKSLVAGEQTELRVVVKADVQGSVDVLKSTLPEIGNENAKIKIVHSGVGAINESDVLLASASDAVILGFHTEPTPKAAHLAAAEGVSIKSYKIIYELTQDLHKSLEGLLEPEKREVVTGHAEIRKVYKSSALGSIAGCMLTDGELVRDASARLMRKGKSIWEGKIGSLRREKDQVSSVQAGFECGIKLGGFDEIEEGDIIEAYKIEVVAKSLS
jgi:translation initiation factor IF-2